MIGGLGKIILIDFIKLTIEGIIEDIRIKDHCILSLLKVSDDFILYEQNKKNSGYENDSKDGQLGIINMKTRKIQEIKNNIEHHYISSMIYINDITIAIGGDSSINVINIK